MKNEAPTFFGDEDYCINTTGDCVTGDEVAFERAVFSGSYFSAKFSHYELIKGKILRESYGEQKQQHTFTIETLDGRKMRIKGRNLYSVRTYRKKWADEAARVEARAEKHARGEAARAARMDRQNSGLFEAWADI